MDGDLWTCCQAVDHLSKAQAPHRQLVPGCGLAKSHVILTGLSYAAEKTKVPIRRASEVGGFQPSHPELRSKLSLMWLQVTPPLATTHFQRERESWILTNLRSRCGGLPHSGIWFNGIKIQIQQAGSLLEGPRGIKLGSSEEEKQYEH